MDVTTSWNGAIDRALELYRLLWSEAQSVSSCSLWVNSTKEPTFVPYDSSEILIGIDAICHHLQARNREASLLHLEWQQITTWSAAAASCSIARQKLLVVNRINGKTEARTLNVIVATIGAGEEMRLASVSEAPSAALLEMSRSYQRHAESRDEL